jgi:hypothetical protein
VRRKQLCDPSWRAEGSRNAKLAAALMAISSLSVTVNSMLMRGWRPPVRRTGRPDKGIRPRDVKADAPHKKVRKYAYT